MSSFPRQHLAAWRLYLYTGILRLAVLHPHLHISHLFGQAWSHHLIHHLSRLLDQARSRLVSHHSHSHQLLGRLFGQAWCHHLSRRWHLPCSQQSFHRARHHLIRLAIHQAHLQLSQPCLCNLHLWACLAVSWWVLRQRQNLLHLASGWSLQSSVLLSFCSLSVFGCDVFGRIRISNVCHVS